MRTHQEIDQRSLVLHRFVADKMRQNPGQFAVARATLARWRAKVDAASQPYLERWEDIMSQGMEACLAIAVEESQRGDALRQCSPFSGILTNSERFRLLRTWKQTHEAP